MNTTNLHSGLCVATLTMLAVALSGCRSTRPVKPTAPPNAQASVEQYILDDFETPWGWSLDSCNNYGTVHSVTNLATRGKRALELECRDGGRGNTMFRCETDWDLWGVSNLWLDVYNGAGAAGVELAVAFSTKQGSFIEMKPQVLQPGWNRDIECDITAAALKDAGVADTWETQKSGISRVMLLVVPGRADRAKLTIDNLRVDKPYANRQLRPTVAGTPVIPERIPVRECAELSLEFCRKSLGIEANRSVNIEVRAFLRSPGGREETVTGFSKTTDDEGLTYATRFYPDEEGIWHATLAYRTGGVWTNVLSREVRCESSQSGGMAKVDSRFRTHFALETGERFYPIGQNVCWAEDYTPYLEALREQRCNLVRVWICPWNNPLLGEKNLGAFNEQSALAIDRLFKLAGTYGVKVQLVFAYHGWLGADWGRNPFNSANGGPCTVAQEFWTDLGARKAFKRYVEQCVRRWSAYPELFAWELVNETDLTPRYDDVHVIDWHREMSDYVKSIDSYDHLVTTTLCSGNSLTALWDLPSIDFCSSHIYNADATVELLKEWRRCEGTGKPYFVTEIGRGWRTTDDQVDPEGRHLHHVLWLGWMTPTAGNCLPWWWDTFIEPNGLMKHFGAVTAFDKGEDRRGQPFISWNASLPQHTGSALEVQGLAAGTRVYGFVYDRERMLDPALPDTAPLLTQPQQLIVEGLTGGTYLAEYWDTYSGQVTQRTTLTCANGQLAIPLPTATKDFAFKVRRTEPSELRVQGR